jgi:hypothetical protein
MQGAHYGIQRRAAAFLADLVKDERKRRFDRSRSGNANGR